MALSTGQINDAFSAALGRTPTGAELQQYSGDNSYEGDPGKSALIAKLGGNKATPSSAPGVSNGGNFEDIANRAIQMNTQAVQPVITSLQASKQPLVDRYNALLGQIKNNQSVAENRQTVTTNNELGARGILPSSGLAQQTLTSALNPITQDYNSTYAQTAAGENSDLNSIDQTIAKVLAGAAQTGITTGAGVYNADQLNATNQAIAALNNRYKEYGYLGGVVDTSTGGNVGGGGSGGGGLSLNFPSTSQPSVTTSIPTSTNTSNTQPPSYFTPANSLQSQFNNNPNVVDPNKTFVPSSVQAAIQQQNILSSLPNNIKLNLPTSLNGNSSNPNSLRLY